LREAKQQADPSFPPFESDRRAPFAQILFVERASANTKGRRDEVAATAPQLPASSAVRSADEERVLLAAQALT